MSTESEIADGLTEPQARHLVRHAGRDGFETPTWGMRNALIAKGIAAPYMGGFNRYVMLTELGKVVQAILVAAQPAKKGSKSAK